MQTVIDFQIQVENPVCWQVFICTNTQNMIQFLAYVTWNLTCIQMFPMLSFIVLVFSKLYY